MSALISSSLLFNLFKVWKLIILLTKYFGKSVGLTQIRIGVGFWIAVTAWDRTLHKFCIVLTIQGGHGAITGHYYSFVVYVWKLLRLWYFWHLPVKSVLRLERLDSGEESFDTEPLMGRRWGSDGIVTTLGTKWGPLQETLGEGLREQQLLGEGVQLEEGVCRVPASHGSPAVS